MAYSEQKASLPPIIEDESDDNSMSMLYRKELGRCASRNEESTVTHSESYSNPSKAPSTTGTPQIPYNSWRSKNAAYLHSPEGGKENSDMLSKLGQSLETCRIMLPQQSKQSSFANNPAYQQDFRDSPQFQSPTQPPTSVQFEEQGRFMNQPLDINDPRHFSSPYDVTNRGYFPKHNSSYQEPSYTPHNPLRNLSSDLQIHDMYKFSPNSERPSYSNIPPPPIGYNPARASSYKLHQMSPNNFQGPMLSTGPPEYQSSCYRNSHLSQTSNDLQNFQDMTLHTPHRNSRFRHEVLPSTNNTPPCRCHENDTIKSKRKENKNEKRREKQIKDLYRIIWLQNQQIMDLQNQVKKLIEFHEKSDEKNKKQDLDHASKVMSKGEKRMFNLSVIEENQNLMEKVSVGIMTSFIDTTTVKGKQKNKEAKSKSRKVSKSSTGSSDSTSSGSSSQSSEEELIPENSRKSKQKQKRGIKKQEDSMMLNGLEIQTVAEAPPSPTSMHIDMQDFGSSSSSQESSESSDSEEEKPVPVSWTFYDKVVGKVNNILKDSESEDEEDDDNDSESGHTVHKRTLEHLRKFGHQFVDPESSPTSKRVTFTGAYPLKPLAESDTSMKMNALAVKYLKEERLSNGREESEKIESGGTNNNNLSYATLRYLERNHLVQKSPAQIHENADRITKTKKKKEKRVEEKTSKKRKSKSSQLSGKILDITAIKQQPKLLPKKH